MSTYSARLPLDARLVELLSETDDAALAVFWQERIRALAGIPTVPARTGALLPTLREAHHRGGQHETRCLIAFVSVMEGLEPGSPVVAALTEAFDLAGRLAGQILVAPYQASLPRRP